MRERVGRELRGKFCIYSGALSSLPQLSFLSSIPPTQVVVEAHPCRTLSENVHPTPTPTDPPPSHSSSTSSSAKRPRSLTHNVSAGSLLRGNIKPKAEVAPLTELALSPKRREEEERGERREKKERKDVLRSMRPKNPLPPIPPPTSPSSPSSPSSPTLILRSTSILPWKSITLIFS